MKTRNINHARNLLDRAVTILPRIDKLWYKFVYMEETLGNVAVSTYQASLSLGLRHILLLSRYDSADSEIFRVRGKSSSDG